MLEALNLQLYNKLPASIFQLICVPFKNSFFQENFKKIATDLKCNVYCGTQSVLLFIFSCYSLHI